MPNDYITLKALTSELNAALQGGRINKINMPSPEEITLQIRALGENHTLLISAKSALPRIYLTQQKISGTNTPSALCMLFRKHLTNGIIDGAETLFNDRIIALNIISKNELHDIAHYRIIVEIMGAQSNIIFTKNQPSGDTIIDCVKRIFGENNRSLFPQMPYEPPKNTKLSINDTTTLATLSALPSEELATAIAQTLSGFSKESAREAAKIATNDIALDKVFTELFDIYNSPRFAPSVHILNGKPRGYFVFPYASIDLGEWQPASSLNQAADIYYSLSSQAPKPPARIRAEVLLKRLKTRVAKKIKDNAKRLEESAHPEELLQLAEILKCNLHRIEQSQSIIRCYDFYNNREIELPLNPTLSASKNVEKYYKNYTKLKGAKAYAQKERVDLLAQQDYLNSIEAGLKNAATATDYEEIERELAALSPLKKVNTPKKKEKPSAPIFLTLNGYTVYIGKNNLQNDKVTFTLADGGDIWLHAKGVHGAHIIVKTKDGKIPNEILTQAAAYAAYMSSARDADKAEVDYTLRKYVKKAGKLGLVTYTNQKSILVKPQKPPE
ncbi:MAG: NFACT RNA binding domain-containing protein [Clostridia bacterium]